MAEILRLRPHAVLGSKVLGAACRLGTCQTLVQDDRLKRYRYWLAIRPVHGRHTRDLKEAKALLDELHA